MGNVEKHLNLSGNWSSTLKVIWTSDSLAPCVMLCLVQGIPCTNIAALSMPSQLATHLIYKTTSLVWNLLSIVRWSYDFYAPEIRLVHIFSENCCIADGWWWRVKYGFFSSSGTRLWLHQLQGMTSMDNIMTANNRKTYFVMKPNVVFAGLVGSCNQSLDFSYPRTWLLLHQLQGMTSMNQILRINIS